MLCYDKQMENKIIPVIFAVLFAAVTPLTSPAQDIIGGVARTVEDIGGQIIGNQAARNGDRAVQRLQENVDHDRAAAGVTVQEIPSTADEGYIQLEGVYDTPVPLKAKPAKTPKPAISVAPHSQ